VADDDVAHYRPDHYRWGQAQPGIVGRQVGLQVAGDAHASQEVIDDRQRPERLGRQLELLCSWHLAP